MLTLQFSVTSFKDTLPLHIECSVKERDEAERQSKGNKGGYAQLVSCGRI